MQKRLKLKGLIGNRIMKDTILPRLKKLTFKYPSKIYVALHLYVYFSFIHPISDTPANKHIRNCKKQRTQITACIAKNVLICPPEYI